MCWYTASRIFRVYSVRQSSIFIEINKFFLENDNFILFGIDFEN